MDEQPITVLQAKKKHHIGRVIGIVFLVIFLLAILLAGLLGFVPGLSDLLGANKPRDLGVQYTAADFASYKQKTGVVFDDYANAPNSIDNPGEKTFFTDPTDVTNLIITQEEVTAAINDTDWAWMPLKNTQVKLSDNTIEISGNLNLNHIKDFINSIGGVGYSQKDIDKALSLVGGLLNNAPIYIKANLSIINNQLSLKVQDVSVGRFDIPKNIAGKILATVTTNIISHVDNLEIKSETLKNGSLLFSGTYPKTIYVNHG
jgi:hypothetical protein